MRRKENKKIWESFFLKISIVILLFFIGIFIGMFTEHKKLLEDEIFVRANTYCDNIILSQKWNSEYGGVYVKKNSQDEKNAFEEEIQTTDGDTYTLVHPALMTKEISKLAKNKGDLQFHVSTLNPIDPEFTPDEFEHESLLRFKNGEEKTSTTIKSPDGKIYFRFMKPLHTIESCLQCHANFGYAPNEIRGGLSVQFDITRIKKSIHFIFYILLALGIFTILLLLGVIYFIIYNLMQRLAKAYDKLEELSITDELSGLYNRRYFFTKITQEFERAKRYQHPLSCVMFDIDHFKKINDSYGHQAGDKVIQAVANILKESTRQSDLVARYGGEEFIMLLSETDQKGALFAAEKVRQKIEIANIPSDNEDTLQCTISAGTTTVTPDIINQLKNPDQLIQQADSALYTAKEQGRNQTVVAQ